MGLPCRPEAADQPTSMTDCKITYPGFGAAIHALNEGSIECAGRRGSRSGRLRVRVNRRATRLPETSTSYRSGLQRLPMRLLSAASAPNQSLGTLRCGTPPL
jgi:hypothetical protein